MQKCLEKLPKVQGCCGCVTDLKVAAAIIAVLAIVTSPMVSWVVIRHMYVVRVSCVVNTNATRPDVVDINMNNVLSFGFGVSPGLGSSCLSRNTTESGGDDKTNTPFIKFVRGSGWVVLIADTAFVLSSVYLLVKMFKATENRSSFIFIVTGFISIILSFVYGMLYVSACVYVGGLFPVFEFFFACFDIIIWIYFLMVVYSFRQKTQR